MSWKSAVWIHAGCLITGVVLSFCSFMWIVNNHKTIISIWMSSARHLHFPLFLSWQQYPTIVRERRSVRHLPVPVIRWPWIIMHRFSAKHANNIQISDALKSIFNLSTRDSLHSNPQPNKQIHNERKTHRNHRSLMIRTRRMTSV